MTQVPDFDALYRDEPDPWRVGTSHYEQRKLGLVLAALTRERYARAWDPACGTGHLAARLAARCDHVTATDLVPTAVGLTQRLTAELDNVAVLQWEFPGTGAPAPGTFDLVVLSEFLYYLPESRRGEIGPLLDLATAPSAEVVAVHWKPEPHDAWLSGAAVQRELAATLQRYGWRLRYRVEDVEFDLAGWRRGPDDDPDDHDDSTAEQPTR